MASRSIPAVASIHCDRMGLGVCVSLERPGAQVVHYDLGGLVDERGGGDISAAIEAVISDLESG